MPGSTLPNTGVIQGSVGGDNGSWGTIVNNALANYDAHDHTIGKGLRITPAAMNINADLSFASAFAPTNLHRLSFASVVALAANNKSLFVSSADNELYWRNNVGTNVKLTSGNALNVGAFVGGIGGDYSSVSAALNFDNAGNRYTLRGAGGTNWARMASGDVRLFETGTADTVFVGLAAPAALAASYTVTWPTALPAAARAVSIDAAGQIAFSDSHGDRTESIHAWLGNPTSAIWAVNTTTKAMESAGSGEFGVTLPLRVGDRIKSLRFMLIGNGVADITTTVTFLNASMVGSSIGTNTTNNQAASWTGIPIDLTDTTIVADSSVVVVFNANAAGLMVGTITYTFDHP